MQPKYLYIELYTIGQARDMLKERNKEIVKQRRQEGKRSLTVYMTMTETMYIMKAMEEQDYTVRQAIIIPDDATGRRVQG